MIPLYRGDLHKVSGIARQWTAPKSPIPISVFKSALMRRNAALSRLMQPSAHQNMEGAITRFGNGSGEAAGPAFGNESDEMEERNGSPSDKADELADNEYDRLDRMLADKKTQTELGVEESERQQERKRKREEDSRDNSGHGLEGPEESSKRDFDTQDEVWKEKLKVSPGESQNVAGDIMEKQLGMDIEPVENTVMNDDETMTELVRVKVSKLGTTSLAKEEMVNELGLDCPEAPKDLGTPTRPSEDVQVQAMKTAKLEEDRSRHTESFTVEDSGMDSKGTEVSVIKLADEMAKKRQELEAKLDKLRAEKHRFVLRLKQVLNEEEMKKRSASGSPGAVQGAALGPYDTLVSSTLGEKHGIGGSVTSGDLEDGELEFARTPSPPSRVIQSIHGSISSQSLQGGPPVVPVIGRQTSLSQHLSQSTSGRGAYYPPGLGVPSSPSAPGTSGGPQSPGAGFVGNMLSPLGNPKYSHNLALQHTSAIHAQKGTSVTHGHSQFSSVPPSGGQVGAVQGVNGGPPGFSGYPVPPSLRSHHSHLSQSTSSPMQHVPGQQGAGSSSLLSTPRGPPGYHDVRLGSSGWIQR